MLLRRCALAVGVALTFSPAAQAGPVNIITSGFYSLAFGGIGTFGSSGPTSR